MDILAELRFLLLELLLLLLLGLYLVANFLVVLLDCLQLRLQVLIYLLDGLEPVGVHFQFRHDLLFFLSHFILLLLQDLLVLGSLGLHGAEPRLQFLYLRLHLLTHVLLPLNICVQLLSELRVGNHVVAYVAHSVLVLVSLRKSSLRLRAQVANGGAAFSAVVPGVAHDAEGLLAVFAFVLELFLDGLHVKYLWQVLLGVVQEHQVALGIVEQVFVVSGAATSAALAARFIIWFLLGYCSYLWLDAGVLLADFVVGLLVIHFSQKISIFNINLFDY